MKFWLRSETRVCQGTFSLFLLIRYPAWKTICFKESDAWHSKNPSNFGKGNWKGCSQHMWYRLGLVPSYCVQGSRLYRQNTEKHKSQATSETDRHINNDLKVKSSLHQLRSKNSIIFSIMEELHEQCNALGTTSGTPPNLANCFPYE